MVCVFLTTSCTVLTHGITRCYTLCIFCIYFFLRVLARHAGSVDEGKRHLLDSVYMLQEAVSLQEHALLRARSWAPSQEVDQTHM